MLTELETKHFEELTFIFSGTHGFCEQQRKYTLL